MCINNTDRCHSGKAQALDRVYPRGRRLNLFFVPVGTVFYGSVYFHVRISVCCPFDFANQSYVAQCKYMFSSLNVNTAVISVILLILSLCGTSSIGIYFKEISKMLINCSCLKNHKLFEGKKRSMNYPLSP